MTYSSILCHPDDFTGVGFSPGWVMAMLLCHPDEILFLSHPDEIANHDFPQHAVALQRFRTCVNFVSMPYFVRRIQRSSYAGAVLTAHWRNSLPDTDGGIILSAGTGLSGKLLVPSHTVITYPACQSTRTTVMGLWRRCVTRIKSYRNVAVQMVSHYRGFSVEKIKCNIVTALTYLDP